MKKHFITTKIIVDKFLNDLNWQPLLSTESCQNLGKTLRKTNYSSEIYQVKHVNTIQKPANQLAMQVN